MTLFKKEKRATTHLLLIFIVSLFVEITQGLLGIGAADVDDIILNCMGGLVGIIGYKFLLLILRNEKKVRAVITILSAIGLPYLLYLLFLVKLRL
ncbi:VanZ like family protein [compost metagenome]